MTWYDPSTLTSHTAASEAWAMISHSIWKAGWIDEDGEVHHIQRPVRPGASLSDTLLEHVTALMDQGFPQDGKLYIASPDCVIAPNTYTHQATTLIHTVLDETIPSSAVHVTELSYVPDACLVYVIKPALTTIWKKIAPQGSIIPFVERDLRYLINAHKEASAVLIHVLPGYIQLTIKENGTLRLCNAFRYQKGEEARLMSRAVIDQFFPKATPSIHIIHSGDSEGEVAKKLHSGVQGATIFTPDQRYWT